MMFRTLFSRGYSIAYLYPCEYSSARKVLPRHGEQRIEGQYCGVPRYCYESQLHDHVIEFAGDKDCATALLHGRM